MHEMSIAEELVKQVVDVARENGGRSVGEVEVELGVFRQVVPEALEIAFAVVAEGTVAEGAVLKMTEKGIVGLCRVCQNRFEASLKTFQCPKCNEADVEIIEGDDIMLTSMAVEIDNEQPSSDE